MLTVEHYNPLGLRLGFEPRISLLEGDVLAINTNEVYMVRRVGIEPTLKA